MYAHTSHWARWSLPKVIRPYLFICFYKLNQTEWHIHLTNWFCEYLTRQLKKPDLSFICIWVFRRNSSLVSGCKERSSFHWLPSCFTTSAKTFWIWFHAWYNGEGLYQCLISFSYLSIYLLFGISEV